ncbi:HBL384Wp [Eremothecium sinecaudum]|uniref:Ubiquinone biosynthesis O-methyltransferase, mitochondrial n=1 Tax=Eremothecium sinecaudum TaxID=45286 RepID=A0A109UW04_9SACH|nr:HBL384Wp [Eremothecium sinecaudum]AMD18518.1 HBL384Wp [Eremothecium sinecaudum]
MIDRNIKTGIGCVTVISRSFSSGRLLATEKYGNFSQNKYTANDEVNHFQALAPSWWDTRGSQRILHKMNLNRMDAVHRLLSPNVKFANPDSSTPINNQIVANPYRALDVGCGGGIFAESLARLPYVKSVDAIDITPDCIKVANAHKDKDPSIKDKISYSLKSLKDVEGTYDVVTMFEVLEHVDNPSEMLRLGWSKLEPGGLMFVSTINRHPVSWFTTILVAEYVTSLVPKGTHHFEKFINSKEITAWFEENAPGSHRLVELKGTMYLPAVGWIDHCNADVGNFYMAVRKLPVKLKSRT